MDVMNVEQAKIAEEAGAAAVMALGMYLCDYWDVAHTILRAYSREHPKRWRCG